MTVDDANVGTVMRLWDAPVVDVRPLLPDLRGDLVEILRVIGNEEWSTTTAVPQWRVKDIALHLLDDDLGRLSRLRDADTSGLLAFDADRPGLVAALNAKNQRWIDGAAGLSRRVVADLLVWAGRELADFDAAADLMAPASVAWASDGPVPGWLDLAREFTEQWVHQQQIREAVRLPGSHHRHLDLVLRTFVWAYPFQLGERADLPMEAVISLDLGEGRCWSLVRGADGWALAEARAGAADAAVAMDAETAWRVLTGAPSGRDGITASGDERLIDAVLAVRGVLV